MWHPADGHVGHSLDLAVCSVLCYDGKTPQTSLRHLKQGDRLMSAVVVYTCIGKSEIWLLLAKSQTIYVKFWLM